MEHKGIQYQVVQTANPTGWKWTVQLDQAVPKRACHSQKTVRFSTL
jgi:hypothetical protein